MDVRMLRIIPLLSALGLFLTSGCISLHVVKEKAQSHLEYSVAEDKWEPVNGHPGYYALLPLTVAGDIATSPFQLGWLVLRSNSHSGSASIYGVPIPLP